MAVLSGTSANTAPGAGVIRAVLMGGLDIENNETITNIKNSAMKKCCGID